MKAEGRRIEWLDMLGGIAVLSVFIQHSKTPLITRLILAVHMPLFFFVAGVLHKSRGEHTADCRDYIRKKFRHIMVPWMLWFLIDFLITAVICIANETMEVGSFFASMGRSLLFFDTFWFLPCFFLAECLFHWLQSVHGGGTPAKDCCWMILFFGASWLENQLVPYRLFFQLDTCLMALGLLFSGSLFQGITANWTPKPKTFLLAGLAAGAAGTGLVLLNGESNFMMYANDYGNYLYAVPAALLLTVSLVCLLKWAPWLPKRYLMFLRKNSLLLFPFHMELLRIVNLVLPDSIQNNLWIYSACCLTVIHVTMYPFCCLVNRYVPVLGGKPKKKIGVLQ